MKQWRMEEIPMLMDRDWLQFNRFTFMADQKKRKLCKLKSTEEFSATLSHNDELQAVTLVKAAVNSLAGMSSGLFRKMIVRDDSPKLEEIDALVDSLEVERQSAAATNLRDCLRSTIENKLFSECCSSPSTAAGSLLLVEGHSQTLGQPKSTFGQLRSTLYGSNLSFRLWPSNSDITSGYYP
ncbi:hypothetical protein TIFTF001_038826 [Ficus carica]|uniref:Uncharacterized protein n=1 Tax=Ficus carica TaxID=3494 RepID=A0AA88ECB4_FICCA|nr:hypothetical protein TIFTF001_038826 [Ficus carica]